MITLLKLLKNILKKLYWVSQKDNGLYDAFNKGLKLARGKYIGIINSDDIYTKNALKIYSNILKNIPKKIFLVLLKSIGVFYMVMNPKK